MQIATYAVESIDLYIQVVEHIDANDPLLEKKILIHPLMQRELSKQRKMLKTLKHESEWNAILIQSLKNTEKGN